MEADLATDGREELLYPRIRGAIRPNGGKKRRHDITRRCDETRSAACVSYVTEADESENNEGKK